MHATETTDSGAGFSRRAFLRSVTAAAAAGAAIPALTQPSASPSYARTLFLPEGAGSEGTYEGARYDPERKAIVLEGTPGSHAAKGWYTSPPLAVNADSIPYAVWRPRWTTPLQWDRYPGNPVIEPTPGSWDASAVTTCSIVPTGNVLKMFYASRDRRIGLAVADRNDIHRWTKRGRPVLEAGQRGAFDDGGVLSPAVVQVSESHWYMYYAGYDSRRVRGSIMVHQLGLAESHDRGETWQRVRTEPVLALGPEGSYDGATISSNCVLKIGERWYNWYSGATQIPYLVSICLATSDDGIHWDKYPYNPVLKFNPYIETEAFLVATPYVLYEEGVFKMWYNAKGFGSGREIGDYRIGYAESLDGIHWERSPRLPVLAPSGSGWDSRMVEYPEILKLNGTYHLWYCGDNYSTIGYATGRAITRVAVETRTGVSRTPNASWSEWQQHDSPLGSALKESRGYVQMRVRLETDDRAITPMVQQLGIASART